MTNHREWDTAHTERKVRVARNYAKRDTPSASEQLSCQTHASFHRGGRRVNSVRGAQAMSLGNRKKAVSLAKISILESD